MNASLSGWLLITLAVLAANLPFLNQRLFAAFPLRRQRKPFWLRLLEMTVLYFLVGAIGRLLESRAGNAFAQGWEFYAITACLFIVFAFPGFVFQYLRKHRG
jgi:hypothetical protein